MNRFHFKKLCLYTSLVLASVLSQGQANERQKPNILFVFADDQAFNTIRALGNHEIETPNLDRLVKRGVTFTHAYNQGAWGGAVCVASRNMLVTGKYLWHAHRAHKTVTKDYVAKRRLWPQLLEAEGYETYFTGKWHIRTPPEGAFNNVRHVRGGMPKQTPEGYNRPIKGKEMAWRPWDRKFGGFWEGGKHWSEVLGDDSVEFLKAAAKKDAPFFMYLAFNAPHDPRQSPKSYVDKYPLSGISIPKSFVPEYPYQIGSNKLRDERLAPFPRTLYSVKVNRQEYYAIITHMDHQIGRILDALEKTGKAKNTYIFFTADHGLAVGHHGLMGKQNMFDHSIRVPLIVVGPGVEGGKRTAPVYLQDIMPTTLELAHTKIPSHVQFRSLLPHIKDADAKGRRSIYGGFIQTQRCVVKDQFKLIVYPKIQKHLLYDLANDPLELNDLAGKAEHKERIGQLYRELAELQKETGDDLKLTP